jgi:hypothetical protein
MKVKLRRIALALMLSWMAALGPLSTHPAAAVTYYCYGQRATIVGTNDPETLAGDAGVDVIVALGGDDMITGGDGADVICAGAGIDTVYGEGGDDRIYGAGGGDWLYGGYQTPTAGDGNDTIAGGPDDDWLYGEDGTDKLYGDGDADHLSGGNNDDWLDGGDGDDIIIGEDGNDYLTGDDGADYLHGGAGFDLLTEWNDGSAVNTLVGGGEADTLIGGNEGDSLTGGPGNDQLDSGSEMIGGKGNDELTARIYGAICEGGVGTDQLIGTNWEPGEDSCQSTADIEVIGGTNSPLVGTWGDEAYVRRLPGDYVFVMLNLTGLEPHGVYPWRIHAGVGFGCSGGDPLPDELELQSYPDLVADSSGNAFVAVTLVGDLYVDSFASASTEIGYAIRVFDAPSVTAPDDPVGTEIRCVGPLDRTPLPWPSQSSHGW